MATTFDVLSEPNRRRILDLLLARERPVGDLVDAMGMSQPAVSKHLRVLRQAGLVEFRSDAQRRVLPGPPRAPRDVDRGWRPIGSCGPRASMPSRSTWRRWTTPTRGRPSIERGVTAWHGRRQSLTTWDGSSASTAGWW